MKRLALLLAASTCLTAIPAAHAQQSAAPTLTPRADGV